jgi:hypothetical protein
MAASALGAALGSIGSGLGVALFAPLFVAATGAATLGAVTLGAVTLGAVTLGAVTLGAALTTSCALISGVGAAGGVLSPTFGSALLSTFVECSTVG